MDPGTVRQHDMAPGAGPPQQVDPDQSGDVVGAGMHPDLVGGALLAHPPVLQHDDPVGEHHRLDRVMGHDQPGAGEFPEWATSSPRT